MDLHRSMRRFRLASRELFNNYFLDEQADEVDDRLLDGFDAVENLLFATLVLEPAPCRQVPLIFNTELMLIHLFECACLITATTETYSKSMSPYVLRY